MKILSENMEYPIQYLRKNFTQGDGLMNNRLQKIAENIKANRYEELLQPDIPILSPQFKKESYSLYTRSSERLRILLEMEIPHVFPEDRIALIRTVRSIPSLFTDDEWQEISSSHFICENGSVFNICSDYQEIIAEGFLAKKKDILHNLQLAKQEKDAEGVEFLQSAYNVLTSVDNFIKKYRDEAENAGNKYVYKTLLRVPEYGARTLQEALQFFRIINYVLWLNGNYHNTIGRFDQYMYPYYKNDIEKGIITNNDAYDLILETFLSLNKDSRLYQGVQQGDNGQSLVLGGCDSEGKPAFNKITELCLKASLEIGMIDPKINLRVNKNTPDEWFVRGTELTKAGLGFPQYSNDDVIIKALMDWGYSLEDARNYVVAACWEFIIPGKGMDIPNIEIGRAHV